MITRRDRDILNHIEKYGFITIEQTRNIFMYEQKCGYDIARRRLKQLVDNGQVKVTKNYLTNENVYYFDKTPKPSFHSIIVMDFYGKLVESGAKILSFQKEYRWLNGKIRSDAFCYYELGDYLYFNILEVCLSNNGSNINKYNTLYESKEAHNLCKGIFPRIIVIDDRNHRNNLRYDDIYVFKLDLKLNNFPTIFSD